MSLTEAIEHVKHMFQSMRSDFSSPLSGEGNVDVRIPTLAEVEQVKASEQAH